MARSLEQANSATQPSLLWTPELQQLYAESWERLNGLATVLTGRRGEAEEIVHDAFVAVAAAKNEPENLGAYVRRSVVNGSYDSLRRRRTRERHEPDTPPQDAPAHLVDFRDVLLKLPWKQRAVVVLRFLDDRSVRETAELLNMNESTVRSHATRGLRTLRKKLS